MCEQEKQPVSVEKCEGDNCKNVFGLGYLLEDLQEFSASNNLENDIVMVCPLCYVKLKWGEEI